MLTASYLVKRLRRVVLDCMVSLVRGLELVRVWHVRNQRSLVQPSRLLTPSFLGFLWLPSLKLGMLR